MADAAEPRSDGARDGSQPDRSAPPGNGGAGGGGAGQGGSGAGGSGGGGSPPADAGVGRDAAGGRDGAGGPGAGGGTGALIDPRCLDGMAYTAEPVPDRSINVDDLIASYNPNNLLPWAIQFLNRRYPVGAVGPSEAQRKNQLDCFNVSFPSRTPSLQDALDGLNTAVHECGHMIDGDERWVIRTDLEYNCSEGLVGSTPPRNIVLGDEFEALSPKGGSLATLRQIYMTGPGSNQTFQVFFTEYNQFVNQMGSAYAYYDKTKERSVADGSRTFAWWLQRYLRILRMRFPAEYNKITRDTCWRRLILADWGRMVRRWEEIRKANMREFWNDETPKVEALVNDPRLLAEIENLRVLDGCSR